MTALLGAIRRAAAARAALATRRAGAPRARWSSSSTETDYQILQKTVDAVHADQEKLCELHEKQLDLLKKSVNRAGDAVRDAATTTTMLELCLVGLALSALYVSWPERPSPTSRTAEAARTTAEAARTTAEAARTAAEAAMMAAEAARTAAEAAKTAAETAASAAVESKST